MLIGELAERSGVAAKTIRYYEQVGVLPPPRRDPNGYRRYDGRALELLGFVRSAQSAGLTLAEIRGVIRLRDEGTPPCQHVTALLDDKAAAVERQIGELQALQRELRRLRARAPEVDPATCDPRAVCEVLSARYGRDR